MQKQDLEKRRERGRRSYARHREKIIAKTIKWQKDNPDKVKESRIRFKLNNPNYRKNLKQENPEKFAEQRFKSLMWRIKVKMSYEDFKLMLKKQNGKCAICREPEVKRRMSVDHCHKTGKVRGLLCQMCNTSLGGFKDNPKLLKKAINYLNKK